MAYVYYYWVNKTTDGIQFYDTTVTLHEAEKLFETPSGPYMILDGLRDATFGFGIIFGTTFDPNDYNAASG